MKTNRIKLLSAGIGAGAAIAMGGLGVAFSDVSTAQPEPASPGRVQPTEITTGETSKQCAMTSGEQTPPPAEATTPEPAIECVAPSEPEVPVATPEITGPPSTE
jgi:hypothetical protein